MKKFLSFLLAFSVLLSFPYTASAGSVNQQVTVYVDGSIPTYDQPPVIIDGTTMIPFRQIFELLGAKVDWNNTNQTVTATKRNLTLQLQIGSNTAYKNGVALSMTQAVKMINDRTMVPLRFVSESLGADVEWNATTRIVWITSAEQLLSEAAQSDDLPTLKQLLAAGASTAVSDERGATPLMSAAKFGDLPAVQALLDAGADVHAIDNAQNDALSYAVLSYTPDKVVQLLLKSGADAKHLNVSHSTALMSAASMDDSDTVQALLNAGADPNQQSDEGYFALYGAVEQSKPDNVKLLLAAGAKPNMQDKTGTSALMHAAFLGNVDAMTALLAAGADPNLADQSDETALFKSVRAKDLTALNFLLSHGADAKRQNKYGITSLNLATTYSVGLPLVQALIPRSDVNAADMNHVTALMTAAYYNEPDAVRALLAAGADPNLKDSQGNTALIFAAMKGDADSVTALLAAKSDPLLQRLDGDTALAVAAKMGRTNIVNILRPYDKTSLVPTNVPPFDENQIAQDVIANSTKKIIDGETENNYRLDPSDVGLILDLQDQNALDAFLSLSEAEKRTVLLQYVQAHWSEWSTASACKVFVFNNGDEVLETLITQNMQSDDVWLSYEWSKYYL